VAMRISKILFVKSETGAVSVIAIVFFKVIKDF